MNRKNENISQNFRLKDHFDHYLKAMGFEKSKLHHTQLEEMERVFMGACGQMLLMFRDGIAAIENEQVAVLQMENLLTQVKKYWLSKDVDFRSN